MRGVPEAGRHVSRAVISFFMAGNVATLRSFNAIVVAAIFGQGGVLIYTGIKMSPSHQSLT